MTKEEQIARFATDLEALMSRYSKEFDLTGVEVVGVLHCLAHRIATNILASPVKPPKKGSG